MVVPALALGDCSAAADGDDSDEWNAYEGKQRLPVEGGMVSLLRMCCLLICRRVEKKCNLIISKVFFFSSKFGI